jgi:deazaflavin-dependent oxidoreductase (nitroreductase family)
MTDVPYRQPDLSLVGPDHVARYLETDGEVGYLWNGAPILLLTTTGRKSGLPRTNALIHGRDGDDYLVVASMGGARTHPNWYQNLVRDPAAQIQDRADRFDVTARTAGDDEKPRLWRIMTEVWPNYDAYQARTERVIPVVVLTPSSAG